MNRVKRVVWVIIIMLISVGLTTAVLFDHFTGHFPWMASNEEGVIKTRIHSALLDEDREVIIYYPKNCDITKKYPVMYVLDGGSHESSILKSLEVLNAAGYCPSMLVVAIPNPSAEARARDLTPPYMRQDNEVENSPGGEGDRFLEFMETELFPFIEKNHPASSYRMISGNSRGGLLVMHSLLAKPGLFQARFCYSTPLWRQDEIIISKVNSFLATQDTLNTFLYLAVGDKESDNIKNGFESMKKVLVEKAPVGFVWDSAYSVNADHQDNVSNAAPLALGKLGRYTMMR